MAIVDELATSPSEQRTAPVVVISSDSHIGPRAREEMRSYCPAALVGEYDEWLNSWETSDRRSAYDARHDANTDRKRRLALNAVPGHYDIRARLRDMDADGVAGAVIFHGSQNNEPLPFLDAGGTRFFRTGGADELEMERFNLERVAVGLRMYNRWLADVCSVEPERHVGLCHLPSWDLDLALKEIVWAREAGLKGVNFPAPRSGIPPFDDPAWEPIWSVCEDLGMALSSHAGAGDPKQWEGRLSAVLPQLETSGFVLTKGLHRLIFGGVFERHPRLKIVYTEASAQPSLWWSNTCEEYDAVWRKRHWSIGDLCPRPPSEYMRDHVFLGASFLHRAPQEPWRAIRGGYDAQVMWGSDYPHAEGTMTKMDGVDSTTRMSLSYIFAGVPEQPTRQIAGLNAARVYGFDPVALATVAERIGSPTIDDLSLPPSEDQIPLYWSGED